MEDFYYYLGLFLGLYLDDDIGLFLKFLLMVVMVVKFVLNFFVKMLMLYMKNYLSELKKLEFMISYEGFVERMNYLKFLV